MRNNRRRPVYIVICVALAVILSVLSLWFREEDAVLLDGSASSGADVWLHVIDVGQGDAIFIDNGDKDILIDAGPRSATDRLTSYLKILNAEIEYAFFSHPHEDHIGGGDEVLNLFGAEMVVMPKYPEDTLCYRQLMQAIEDNGCELIYAASGDLFESGDITIDVLSPGRTYKTDDPNHISLIMKVSYGDIDMMFTGDAEESNEDFVVRKYPEKLDCEILKVGHHGSSSSSTQDFLDMLTPEIALISLGEGNMYGHPHTEALYRLNSFTDEVHRTDKEGDLVVGMTKNKYWFEKE